MKTTYAIFLILSCVTVKAQWGDEKVLDFEPVYTQFTTREGLASNQAFDVVFTDNIQWVATESGISQFDGHSFQNYSSEELQGVVLKLVPDSADILWFFTDLKEIGKFNTSLKTFEVIQFESLVPSAVKITDIVVTDTVVAVSLRDRVYHLKKDSLGYLLSQFKVAHGEVLILDYGKSGLISLPNSDHVNVSKFICRDMHNGSYESVHVDSTFYLSASSRVTRKGESFFVSLSEDLYRINFSRSEVLKRTFRERINFLDTLTALDGDLACTLRDKGTCFLDEDLVTRDSILPRVPVSSIFRRFKGELWLTSQSLGLFFIPDVKARFIEKNQETEWTVGSIHVLDRLVLATFDGSLLQVSEETGSTSLTILKTGKDAIYNLFKSQRSNDFVTRKGMDFHEYTLDDEGLHLNKFREEDRKKNKFTADSVWVIWDKEFIRVYGFNKDAAKRVDSLRYGKQETLRHCKFEDSTFVFATKNHLYSLNIASREMQIKLISLEGREQALVTNIQLLNDRNALIGTKKSGIWLLEDFTQPIKLVDISQLNNEEVRYTHANDSCIYIGTNKGLWLFDQRSSTCAKHWLSGLHHLYPLDVKHINTLGSNVFLSSPVGYFLLPPGLDWHTCGASPTVEWRSAITYRGVTDSIITLDYTAVKSIGIKFEYAHYLNALTRRFRLKINDDSNWTVTTSPVFELGALQPGEYRFDMEVERIRDQWVPTTPESFLLVVNPPFWTTWWFYLGLGVLVVGFIWLLVINRINAAKARRKTKFHALKAQSEALALQLNPHFLFNSFNSTIAYIGSAGNKESIEMLTKLSRLMRKVFHISEHTFHPVSDEIALIREYLDIEQLRFKRELEFEVHTPIGLVLESISVPVLLLQPIIENSVKHGFAQRDGALHIDMNIRAGEDCVVIQIADNGPGLCEKSEEDDKRFSSIAAMERRFKILAELSNEIYRVSMDNAPNGGTITTLWLPLNPQTQHVEL